MVYYHIDITLLDKERCAQIPNPIPDHFQRILYHLFP